MAKNKNKKTDKVNQSASESPAVVLFRKRCEDALSKVNNIQEFRDDDAMVNYVFMVGKNLFDKPLDLMSTDHMLRTGGRLSGVYVYFGQKSARARAERDVYAQKASELEKERLLALMGKGIKVTEARSMVAAELVELHELVIVKNIEKNRWENITEAVEKMVSFIQSAIKVKEGERYQSSKIQHNAG